jgi:hypothetical protein
VSNLDDGQQDADQNDQKSSATEATDDTEGHLLPLDHGSARNLHNARTREIDRDVRSRNQEREARSGKQGRPNRP